MEIEFSFMGVLELVTVLLAIVYVILAAKEHIWCWPFGIVSSAIGVYITYENALLGQSLMYVYYVVMGVYGWTAWSKKDESTPPRKAKWWSWKSHAIAIAVGVSASTGAYFLLNYYTDGATLYLDCITATFSFIATFMLTRKIIDNWIYWIVIDTASLVLYMSLELVFFTGLFAVYLVLSIYGLVNWYKQQQRHGA